ncbi:hypothetical protein C2S52_018518 [Perilla frutescens var. hirtella]|nr:hypothetical protein C2S52_018518 [Perilla frutescens var. hirtella]
MNHIPPNFDDLPSDIRKSILNELHVYDLRAVGFAMPRYAAAVNDIITARDLFHTRSSSVARVLQRLHPGETTHDMINRIVNEGGNARPMINDMNHLMVNILNSGRSMETLFSTTTYEDLRRLEEDFAEDFNRALAIIRLPY